jgi:hypothetical protein
MKRTTARLFAALLLLLSIRLHAATTPVANKPDGKTDPKAAKTDKGDKYDASTFAGLSLRNIGPAFTSGRIIDLAVDPRDTRTWYIATAGGGIWKTTNAGTTFFPVFDDEETSTIGCITIDPNDSLVVWAGSGENNSQRSISWGNGVYKSVDGGTSW